jgi:type IV pilus assembly protein PilB
MSTAENLDEENTASKGADDDRTTISDPRAIIRAFALFNDVGDEVVDFVSNHLESCFYSQGEPIILQGERNDHVYFLRTGSVEIVNYLADEKRVQRVTLLKPGAQFAEFSVLSKNSRSSSAYAYEDCEICRIHGEHFMQMLTKFPQVPQKLSYIISDFIYALEASGDFIPYVKLEQTKSAMNFADLIPPAQWSRLGALPLGTKGQISFVALRDPRSNALVDYLQMAGNKNPVVAYLIDSNTLSNVIESVDKNKFPTRARAGVSSANMSQDVLDLLRSTNVFKDFPDDVLAQIRDNIPTHTITAGQTFIKPADKPTGIYLVLKGKLQLSRPIEGAKAEAAVYETGAGDWIGEVEYFCKKPFLHFVRAIEDTVIIPFAPDLISQFLDTSIFTLPLAQQLAARLQSLNQVTGVQYYKSSVTPGLESVRDLIPKNVMAEHHVIPLEKKDSEVLLGVVSTDHAAVFGVVGRYLSDHRVKIVNITELQFKSWLMQIGAGVRESEKENGSLSKTLNAAEAATSQTDPTPTLNEIFMKGLSLRASDIHFESFEKGVVVRFRIDGELHEHPEKFSASLGKQIVSRLKILSSMDIANHFTPQDGQLKTMIGDLPFLARASALPVKYGEKIVLRIIRQKGSIIPANMLVPDRRSIQMLHAIARSNQGLFLVTGPTGSGKTSTLYSLVHEVNKVGMNVVTIEEPVEMEISGCNQVEIDRKKGLDFHIALRSVLRQDPDVIMVGEIRDSESAKIVFEAAITGHLVFSTLHTNSSLDVPARLKELGVPPATMSAGLLGVLAQRLIRAICKKCQSSRPVSSSEKKYVQSVLGDVSLPDTLYYGRGCSSCHQTGYYDRLPVFEMWRNNLPMNNALLHDVDLLQIERIAREDHFETLLEFGVRMALIGLTTLEEVRKYLSNVAA